ncbi:MAG TPA: addiction module protein [Immundisolibacter sp.]|jgi:putative addiction module component (TIGR02574 family)
MKTDLLDQARKLSLPEQIDLVEALWDSIAGQADAALPTAAQREELDRRVADQQANPHDLHDWSDVKATALARLGR